jgi:UDP-N-acetylmuramyl pentapeptide phosphotransferase/UDP-N-acetylglucosamine-1-phosphate transferase
MFPIAVFCAVVIFQLVTTWLLFRSDIYLREEKASQAKLIWALPLLGAVIVAIMLWDDFRNNK